MEIINRVINNVNITFIKTKKFKSIAGVLCFESFATRKKMTTRTFLRNMLVYNTKKFPTNEDLNTNCLENFDASFGANSYRTGDIYTNSFYFKTLEDEYTEEGNLENVIDTFCEIIFNPNIKNEEFDKKSFDNRKKKLREFYERIKENQRDYAEHRIIKFLNQNKEYSYQFELEELEKITPSSLYEEYKEMIEQSKVNLLLVGNIGSNTLEDLLWRESAIYLVARNEESLGKQAHRVLVEYIKANYKKIGEVLGFDAYAP